MAISGINTGVVSLLGNNNHLGSGVGLAPEHPSFGGLDRFSLVSPRSPLIASGFTGLHIPGASGDGSQAQSGGAPGKSTLTAKLPPKSTTPAAPTPPATNTNPPTPTQAHTAPFDDPFGLHLLGAQASQPQVYTAMTEAEMKQLSVRRDELQALIISRFHQLFQMRLLGVNLVEKEQETFKKKAPQVDPFEAALKKAVEAAIDTVTGKLFSVAKDFIKAGLSATAKPLADKGIDAIKGAMKGAIKKPMERGTDAALPSTAQEDSASETAERVDALREYFHRQKTALVIHDFGTVQGFITQFFHELMPLFEKDPKAAVDLLDSIDTGLAKTADIAPQEQASSSRVKLTDYLLQKSVEDEKRLGWALEDLIHKEGEPGEEGAHLDRLLTNKDWLSKVEFDGLMDVKIRLNYDFNLERTSAGELNLEESMLRSQREAQPDLLHLLSIQKLSMKGVPTVALKALSQLPFHEFLQRGGTIRVTVESEGGTMPMRAVLRGSEVVFEDGSWDVLVNQKGIDPKEAFKEWFVNQNPSKARAGISTNHDPKEKK